MDISYPYVWSVIAITFRRHLIRHCLLHRIPITQCTYARMIVCHLFDYPALLAAERAPKMAWWCEFSPKYVRRPISIFHSHFLLRTNEFRGACQLLTIIILAIHAFLCLQFMSFMCLRKCVSACVRWLWLPMRTVIERLCGVFRCGKAEWMERAMW